MIDDKKIKNEFYSYVGNAVDYYKRKQGLKNQQLAIELNVSESFIKKANTGKSKYNSLHLWILGSYLKVSLNKLTPPVNDFLEYQKIRPKATKKSYENFIKKLNN